MAWGSAGIVNNPGLNQVLADTGPLPATPFVPTIMCWSSTPCLVTLRHKNAANSADLHTQQMALTTIGNSFQIFGLPTSITLSLNERLVITNDSPFSGQIQCSILTT